MTSIKGTLRSLLFCCLFLPAWVFAVTPSVTGTESQIDASAAASGSDSITVPADADAVVAFWAHWDGNNSTTLSTLSIDGSSFLPAESEVAEGATSSDAAGMGVALLENPSTGSQTLSWAWSSGGARSEGGEIVLVYVKDANAGDVVRDSGVDAQTGAETASVALTTTSSDLVVGFVSRYTTSSEPASFDASGPSITLLIDDADLNSHAYDVATLAAGASSTTVSTGTTNRDFSAVAAISLKESTGGGGAPIPTTLRRRRD